MWMPRTRLFRLLDLHARIERPRLSQDILTSADRFYGVMIVSLPLVRKSFIHQD